MDGTWRPVQSVQNVVPAWNSDLHLFKPKSAYVRVRRRHLTPVRNTFVLFTCILDAAKLTTIWGGWRIPFRVNAA